MVASPKFFLRCILALFFLQREAVSGFHPVSPMLSSVTHPRRNYVNCQAVESTSDTKPDAIDRDVLSQLNECGTSTQARNVLDRALGDSQQGRLFGSISIPRGASDRGISDGDLAIQTRIRNRKYSIMELIELNGDRDADRASLAILSLMIASTGSALVANQKLPGPEILRFVVVWLLSFAPLIFVVFGIATPEKLQILLISLQRSIFPAYRKRMIQHEAGHFLMGHLLGLPIKGYTANAIKNAVEFYPLSDPDVGRERARLLGFDAPMSRGGSSALEDIDATARKDAPYFSREGRGGDLIETQSVFRKDKNYTDNPFLKLPSQQEPSNAWPYRGFDHATVDQLAVVSVAGVCAEILAFGNAEGGLADLNQLRQIFNSAEPELSDRDSENRIRFALGYTMSQLRTHLAALDALADVMERDGSVAECVLAIECCENVSGQDGISEDYERRRRARFRSEGVGIIERLALGGDKNADVEEDRLIEGRGGGYRQERFQLSGDDPLYAALAVATAFLLWASSGGITLH